MVKKAMQFKDGYYEVSMAWKSDPNKLPENYVAAYKRRASKEKKLIRNIRKETKAKGKPTKM